MLVVVLLMTSLVIFSGAQKQKKEKEIEIIMVHKLLGIPWIVRETQGVKDAGLDLGIKSDLIAPAVAGDVAQQVKLIEDLVARGVDGIVIVPNDPEAVAPVLEKATKMGIVTIAHESPGQKGAMYDIEAFDNKVYGRRMMDQLVKYMGNSGGYVAFVGELTALTHNIWQDAARAQAKEKYPKVMELTDRIPTHDDLEISYKTTLDLIKSYPNLKGILGSAATDAPGAAKAIEEKGLKDKIVVGGTSIPSMAGKYIASGAQKWGQAWDPYDLGYATVWAAWWLSQGKKFRDGMDIPRLGVIKIDGTDIYGDVPIFFTKENISQYPF
jgi:simple sugar transport system substrate-binding protein